MESSDLEKLGTNNFLISEAALKSTENIKYQIPLFRGGILRDFNREMVAKAEDLHFRKLSLT